jgi:6-pyruvoyltetrahydropterin/6-carboxytetrahydropterin synthase
VFLGARGHLLVVGTGVFEVAFETTFCATHALTRGGEPIEPLHGHDWRVEVVAAGSSLDDAGVVLDFERLKEALLGVVARFHYRDLGADDAFAGRSPSAEEVARVVFEEVRARLGDEAGRLRRVRVWEAPGCSASFLG